MSGPQKNAKIVVEEFPVNLKRADIANVIAIASLILAFIALIFLGFSPGILVGILIPSIIIAGLTETVRRYHRVRNRKKNRSNDQDSEPRGV